MDEQNNSSSLPSRTGSPDAPSWRSNALRELRIPSTKAPNVNYNATASDDALDSRESVSLIDENSVVDREAPVMLQPSSRSSTIRDEEATTELLSPRNTIMSWAIELFALFLSSASIVAIVALLIHHNNKPIADWTFVFSLNTVVAALGTIARTTLALAISACIGQQKWSWLRRRSDSICAFERFDEASRGPWGGTRLFVWLRFRHWAALGALVTVGTVAFDPFFQAVISTHGQLDDTSTSATIGRTLRVDGGELIEFTSSSTRASAGAAGYTDFRGRSDFGVISSINAGLHNTSAFYDNTVAFECATGNCTWPQFVSAAVCSACEDVSQEVTLDARSGDKNGSNIPVSNVITLAVSNYTIFSLPFSEIKNWNGYSKIDSQNWYDYTSGGGMPLTLMTVKVTTKPQDTLRFSDMRTMLMAFTTMRAPIDWIENRTSWESSRAVATECALYFCANAYRARSKNGELEEEIVGSWATADPVSYKSVDGYEEPTRRPNADTRAETDAGSLDKEESYRRSDLRLLVPPEQLETLPSSLPRDVNISYALIRTTIDYLRNFTGNNDRSSYLWAYPDIRSPSFIDVLWGSTNLTTTFDNVAKSMTNQFRNTSPQRHEGSVQRWVIHIGVYWAYLAFPITMLLAGILYVILIIVESTRLSIPVWKERVLPTLLYGFDDETQQLLKKKQGYEWTKEKDIDIRFDYDGQKSGLRLVN